MLISLIKRGRCCIAHLYCRVSLALPGCLGNRVIYVHMLGLCKVEGMCHDVSEPLIFAYNRDRKDMTQIY